MCVRRLWTLMFHMPDGAWMAVMRHRTRKDRVTDLDELDRIFGGLKA